MATHTAVVTPGTRLPLVTVERPTRVPEASEVLVRVLWTASTPLDLHQADGGLLVSPPQVLGTSFAGVVVEVGADVADVSVDDEVRFHVVRLKAALIPGQVFGYAWRSNDEKAHQEFVTVPSWLLGKVECDHHFP
jgi:NADPH:quinone reductase-like Zn-dependent oxidoreductase